MKILFVAALCLATLAPAIASGDGCNLVTIDFSELPNGTKLGAGAYLSDEWYGKYGLTLSAKGGLGELPRIFDTSNPGTKRLGDPDLGSPNEDCGGPGKGEGGKRGAIGENCKPLGNVLIIQEDNGRPDIPDDNVNGGVITFRFDKPLRVKKIGLLDIDYKTFLTILTAKSGEPSSSKIPVPMLGDNSAQTVNVNTDDVIQLDLNLRRSGAITFISFCYDSDLAGIGEVCYGDDTCETDYCFNAILPDGTIPAGVCSCNPNTNAGCEDEEQCDFSPLVDIGPPGCFLPMGATCSVSSQCISDHCFEEKCVCNTDLNFPCSDNEACTFQESNGYLCLLKIGEPCYGSGCESEYCFNAVPPGGTIPAGICSCNPSTNFGCEDPTECAFSPLIDIGPPDCFLPMGATCSIDSQCISDHCFEGKCVCNEDLNFPCSDNEACTFQEGSGYLCLLKIGEPCYGGGCESEYCFNAVLPGDTIPAGICSCNPSTNFGCEDPTECAFSPLVEIGPPDCFLPMGATCLVDSQCISDHCFEEMCVCNEILNFPCEDDETCTFEEVSGFACRESLKGIGEDCLEDNECQTAACWADWFITPEYPGYCICNSKTNEGCPDGKDCLWPTRPGSGASCFLPVGTTCVNDSECYSESCVDNVCAVCNEATNYPCPPDLMCVPDDVDGYDCLPKAGDLRSKYLRNDVWAQLFLGTDDKFSLPTATEPSPVGNLQWRIINAMRMTGSDRDSIHSGETIDAETLRAIDAELVKAEAIIATQAAKLPNFSDISGPDYLDNMPQAFAAHMYATILELFNSGPTKYQTLSNECLLANMIPQMCGALVDMGVDPPGSSNCGDYTANLRDDQIIQSPELFGFVNVRREIGDDEFPLYGDFSTMSYVSTLVHEFVHDLDARWSYSPTVHAQYDRQTVCSPNLVDFAAAGTPFAFVGGNGNQNIEDFVSRYAAGLSNQYQDYRPWEDVAESVEAFMMVPNYFKSRAAASTILQAKYDYIRDNMFGGIEFENLNDLVVPKTYTVPNTLSEFSSGRSGEFEVRTFRVTDIRVRQ